MTAMTAKALDWTESGLVPDAMIRAGIRRLLDRKLREIRSGDLEYAAILQDRLVERMNRSPVALVPHLANAQHYEVPADFFLRVLGGHLKYSCCYWPVGVQTLAQAETAALTSTVERAGVEDGMEVLDLGCGWGSLSLFVARQFPACRVTAVSNSRSQHDFIAARAAERGLANLSVVVADMNDFAASCRYDRVISIEMFEHMRNYGELYRRIAGWLKPSGRFFMHVFCHSTTPYEYVDNGPTDWMSRHFFSGGLMPSADLPLRFAEHLAIERRWHWSGVHYAKTLRAWLERMDQARSTILPVLEATYGDGEGERWWMRWRMFFMACEELFGHSDGREWLVGQYLFSRRQR